MSHLLSKSPDTRFIPNIRISEPNKHLEGLLSSIPFTPYKKSKRMVCSIGKTYSYSNQVAEAHPWNLYPPLEKWLQVFNDDLGTNFNSALINWYPRGTRCGIGQHSDNEKEIVSNTEVLSVSLGASCIFNFHENIRGQYPTPVVASIELKHGEQKKHEHN